MKDRARSKKTPRAAGRRVYELEVSIEDGPIGEQFLKKNPVMSRTIQIRGDQTLARLHEAIFDAFDRDEEHMFEFQVGGKQPLDHKAKRYVLPMDASGPFDDDKPAGLVTRTTIDALGLKVGQAFWYWFDFGDDWWHRISLSAIHEGPGSGQYPRVTAKVGDSPPQYRGWGEGEDEADAEEE